MVTEKDVLSVLSSQVQPVTAKELVRVINATLRSRTTKKEVNPILYRLLNSGKVEKVEQLKWRTRAINAGRQPQPERTPGEHTLYDILEVAPHAHPEVIQKAYKLLALRFHPDRCRSGDRKPLEEKMKLINLAYETLSDPAKRAAYDAKIAAD